LRTLKFTLKLFLLFATFGEEDWTKEAEKKRLRQRRDENKVGGKGGKDEKEEWGGEAIRRKNKYWG
jgi:hypothetical protein